MSFFTNSTAMILMKNQFFFIVFTLFTIQVNSQTTTDRIDNFLSATVKKGKVNYQLIQDSKQAELDSLINHLNRDIISTKENKANYINLYNLLVIQQVVQHYPTNSPMDIPGFFDRSTLSVGADQKTLNHLENNIIRAQYKDSRVHFALVCGAIDCPPLQSYAYREENLNKQLYIVTSEAINNPNFIKTTKEKSEVSSIFQWYIADFGNSEKGIIEFINKFNTSDPIKSISFYSYNWQLNDSKQVVASSNVAIYTPSVLLRHQQFEVQLFNNLYTQTAWRNENGEKTSINGRDTYNTLLITFNYGISKSGRFNLGLDVNLRSVRTDLENTNAIDIFKLEQNNISRTTISTLGPKIKWNPIRSIPKFSIQSSFLIPVADSLETKQNRPWLDYERNTWWTQFFWDRPIGNKFQLFAEADILLRMPKFGSSLSYYETILSTPLSVFFSYFPTPKSTVYVSYQYSPTLTSLPSYYMQAGLGAKYQIFEKVQLEMSYTNFFAGISNGAGNTYNVGLRYIR